MAVCDHMGNSLLLKKFGGDFNSNSQNDSTLNLGGHWESMAPKDLCSKFHGGGNTGIFISSVVKQKKNLMRKMVYLQRFSHMQSP